MKKRKPIISLISLFILLGLLISFSINSISHSGRKAFWQDEAYSYSHHLVGQSLSEILVKGPTGQSSPSPLDYLILHGVYQVKKPLSYLNLQPYQYFRIHYLVVIWLVLLYLFYFFKKNETLKNLFLFSVISGTFLLNSTIYYYSSEMRPYSLWASLSLLCLFLISRHKLSKVVWVLTIIGLSLTTTASLLQLVSIIGAHLLVEMISQKKVKIKLKVNYFLIILMVGILINLYYIKLIPSKTTWGGSATWSQFKNLWLPYIPIIISGFALTWYYLKSKQKNNATASLTGVIWVLFGPVVYLITLNKGYFLDPKQYIYYHPIFFLYAFQLAEIFFTKVNKLKIARILVIMSIIPFSWSLIHNLNITLPIQAVRTVILGDPISIPVNYQKITSLIPNKIPSKIEFVPVDQLAYVNEVAGTNLGVWIEYLNIVYPQPEYPRDETKALRVRARDNSIEILEVEPYIFK